MQVYVKRLGLSVNPLAGGLLLLEKKIEKLGKFVFNLWVAI
jgi:hypothetical protein